MDMNLDDILTFDTLDIVSERLSKTQETNFNLLLNNSVLHVKLEEEKL